MAAKYGRSGVRADALHKRGGGVGPVFGDDADDWQRGVDPLRGLDVVREHAGRKERSCNRRRRAQRLFDDPGHLRQAQFALHHHLVGVIGDEIAVSLACA